MVCVPAHCVEQVERQRRGHQLRHRVPRPGTHPAQHVQQRAFQVRRWHLHRRRKRRRRRDVHHRRGAGRHAAVGRQRRQRRRPLRRECLHPDDVLVDEVAHGGPHHGGGAAVAAVLPRGVGLGRRHQQLKIPDQPVEVRAEEAGVRGAMCMEACVWWGWREREREGERGSEGAREKASERESQSMCALCF